jgi:phosphoribosylamine--glycine ligase
MRVLVIGAGGREHALVWKIAQSRLVDKIFSAPGNAGISEIAQCLDIKADDIYALAEFARKEKIDLTVVGPELPLAKGIVDEFSHYKLKVFGPTKQAARIEASKIFAKQLMQRYNIPTASCEIFDQPAEAIRYIEEKGPPCVVKADGLAAGKGVIVSHSIDEAKQAVVCLMQDKIFEEAGSRVIIEDCLEGQEASILVFTDSKEVIPLATSQDHKRVFDNDAGANTGGMGAYSPAPIINTDLYNQILKTIVYPAIDALVKEGIIYKGLLYVGIMLTKEGPKVLEFNVRFGDPETQAILPRLKSDIVEIMLAVCNEALGKIAKFGPLNWDSRACVCVVCASEGYPGRYEKGRQIHGLEEVRAMQDIAVFHAATKALMANGKSQIVTNGGRVLGVSGLGNTIKEAIDRTYRAVNLIHFEGMHYRKDIGRKAIL